MDSEKIGMMVVVLISLFSSLIIVGALPIVDAVKNMESREYKVLDTHTGIIYLARNIYIEKLDGANIRVYNTFNKNIPNLIIPSDPEGQYQLTLVVNRQSFWGRKLEPEIYTSYFNLPDSNTNIEQLLRLGVFDDR